MKPNSSLPPYVSYTVDSTIVYNICNMKNTQNFLDQPRNRAEFCTWREYNENIKT